MQIRRMILVGACIATFPPLASAHPIKGVGDFYDGVLHPLMSLDFALPLVALALLAGQQRREAATASLGAFPISLVVGAAIPVALHFSLTGLPGTAQWFGPVVMTLAGVCVALSLQGSTRAIALLFSILGLILGATQGIEISPTMSAPKFVLGVGCSSLIVTAYGIGLVRWLRRPWIQIAFRVAGSWIAAAGLMVLALTGNRLPR